mgnify:CR=1 FL=1
MKTPRLADSPRLSCLLIGGIFYNNHEIDLSSFYKNYGHNIKQLSILRKIAKGHGGECLSEFYINCNTKLNFKCKNDHLFEKTPSGIKDGYWCKMCKYANQKRKANPQKRATSLEKLEKIKQIAIERGGECLSLNYINRYTKLSFKCGQCDFIWETACNIVSSGSWCPNCNKQKKIENLKKFRYVPKIKHES